MMPDDTHNKMIAEWMKDPAFKAEYDRLNREEYALLDEILKARRETGLSQAEIARRMGTKAPAIARLEAALASGKHSPSIATLRKYAKALGKQLDVRLV
jgi:ribosome-binding protein aMBF1 (putative translation factor)